MSYKYEHLMRLTSNELHNHCERLLKKGVNPMLVADIKRTVLENKAHRKSHRAHLKQVHNQWRVIMSPLMHEKKAVRSLSYYKNSKSPEQRSAALEAYAVVLDTLEHKLKAIESSGTTPMQHDKTKTHWTDYVPQHIKDRVCALFDAIPHYPRQKVKHPFPRTMPEEQHTKLKTRLILRTEKDLRRAKQDAMLNPDNEQVQELVKRITKALEHIDKLESNEPVPTTWHGLKF
jgi:hypothetical protein